MSTIKTLICLVLFCMFVLCNTVRPFFISESDEITMGNKFKAQILADTTTYPLYKGDIRVSNYVDSLGKLISFHQKDWNTPDLQFTFTIIKNDSMVNAFAVPGGHVFIYTGLLLAAENEAQVAGVLAHEIGHITHHHSANMMVKQNMIGIVNSIVFGNDSSAASAVTSLLEGLTFLRFSRDDENEADKCAVEYTTLVNINPVGMSEFLAILKNQYGNSPRILEPFEKMTSSHPLLSDRIKNVNDIIMKTTSADTSINRKISEYNVIKKLLK